MLLQLGPTAELDLPMRSFPPGMHRGDCRVARPWLQVIVLEPIMSDVWFTADFHLGHANIIRYCDRPFENIAQMDTEIIDRLNSSVAENDLLYFLGDFCRGSGKDALAYRKRIRCKNIFFIEGNHDACARKILTEFRWWKQLTEVKVNDHLIVLCHYAMRVWHHSFRGSWHLYGHSHGRLPDDPTALSMDVGVDTHHFRPWHVNEIAALMERKFRHRAERLSSEASMDVGDARSSSDSAPD